MPNKPYLRFFMRVTHISPPFNMGQFVEVKFEMERECGRVITSHDCPHGGGELHLRMPADHAPHYTLGDEYAVRLYKV